MGIEMSKVVDVIVGIMVLIFAINIAVLPVAKNTLGPLFSIGEQTKQYLNDTGGKDFTAFDIEKSYGIAGVSIMGLIDSVKELSKGVDSQIDLQEKCQAYSEQSKLTVGTDITAAEASACVNMGYSLKITLREMESLSYTNPLKALNDPIVEKGLFGKELNKRNYQTYLCDFFMHGSTSRMNAFIYFTELPDAKDLTTFNCKINDKSTLTYYIKLNTLQGNVPDLKLRKSYRLVLVREANFGTFMLNPSLPKTSTGGYPSLNFDEKDIELRATSDNVYWTIEPIIYIDKSREESLKNERYHLTLSKTDNDMVGCTQYYDEKDLKRDCYVSGFELPEKPYPKVSNLIEYFRAKAAAYRSPSYVFYFEKMPEGEESAWGYDMSVNLAKNIAIGGITNSVFDMFGFVKAVGKSAKAASMAKAAAALGEATQDMVAKEALEKVEEDLLEEGAENIVEEFEQGIVTEALSEGGEAATKTLETAYFSNAFESKKSTYQTLVEGLFASKDSVIVSKTSKEMVDRLEVELGEIVREEGAEGLKKVDAEYLKNIGFTRKGLKDIGDARELVADDLQLLVKQIQDEATKIPQREIIEKVMSSKTTVKSILTSLPKDQLKEKFDAYVTQRLLKALPDELDDKVMKDIMQRFYSETDVVFKQLEKEGFDVASFTGVNDQVLDGVEKMITEKYSSAKFFKNIPIKSTLRKSAIITVLVLKDWLENVGMEKYYPQGSNEFVLYDPTSSVKKDRLATFDIESNFMPYINLNKPPANNRFYLASPCKADLRVSKKICACDVSSGSILLKDGQFLRPAQGIPIPENTGKRVYLWDQLTDDQKANVRSKYNSAVGFLSAESFKESAQYNFYKDRILQKETEDAYYLYFKTLVEKFYAKGYYQYLKEMVPNIYSTEDEHFRSLFDKADRCYSGGWVFLGFFRELGQDSLLRPVYEIDYSTLNYETRPLYSMFIMGTSGIHGQFLDKKEGKVCDVDSDNFMNEMLFDSSGKCARSTLSKDEFLQIYRKYANCYINYPQGRDDYRIGAGSSPQAGDRDSWTFLEVLDDTYYEVMGLDSQCRDAELKKCISGRASDEESYKKYYYCNSFSIGKCNKQESRDEQILREWFVNYIYVNSEDTSTANVVYECNDARSFGGDVKETPLGKFQKSTSVDTLYYQKREGNQNYYNNHFSVSVPCIDVKTDNMNYPDYNDDYNFCHMGEGAVNAEKARKVASLVTTFADLAISVGLNFIPGVGQAATIGMVAMRAAVSPVVSFGTGAAAAAIDTYFIEQYRWPKYQKNSMYDGWT